MFYKETLQITELDLRNNELKTIEESAFDSLVSLWKLNLSNNVLEKIKKNGLIKMLPE